MSNAWQVAGLKSVFRKWDRDSSGVISRQNLTEVMQEISALTEYDIDRLMSEADANKNGVIEYDEFVDWLLRPAQESQARAILDFADVLRPLFDVFDLLRTGFISIEEFKECHTILRAALRKHEVDLDLSPELLKRRSSMHTPLQLHEDGDTAFREMDGSGDGVVSFHDFVNFMKNHLSTDKVPLSDLVEITANLVKMLKGVFRLKQIAKAEGLRLPGDRDEEADMVLERLMTNLAKTADQFEQALGLEPPPPPERNLWTEPPAGLSVERLKCAHMAHFPLSMRHVEDVTFEVLVVPSPENQGTPAKRRWLAEVVRKSKIRRNKKFIVEAPMYYAFEPTKLRWAPQPDCGEFNHAVDKLPAELGVFCFLKTQSNFGVELDWANIQIALRGAVNMDLIARNDLQQFEAYMKNAVLRQMETKDPELVPAFLDQLSLKPRIVMATLTELGIVKVSPVWREFMPEHDGLTRRSTTRRPSNK